MKPFSFPKTVAIAWVEGSSAEDSWPEVKDDPAAHAEMGEKKKVGIYRLEKIVTVEGAAQVT